MFSQHDIYRLGTIQSLFRNVTQDNEVYIQDVEQYQ